MVLDFSIVNVALPAIRDEFGLSPARPSRSGPRSGWRWLALLVVIFVTRTEALAASGVPRTEALTQGFRYAVAFGVTFPIIAALITLFSLHEKRLS